MACDDDGQINTNADAAAGAWLPLCGSSPRLPPRQFGLMRDVNDPESLIFFKADEVRTATDGTISKGMIPKLTARHLKTVFIMSTSSTGSKPTVLLEIFTDHVGSEIVNA